MLLDKMNCKNILKIIIFPRTKNQNYVNLFLTFYFKFNLKTNLKILVQINKIKIRMMISLLKI
jgi:hypothetical protein